MRLEKRKADFPEEVLQEIRKDRHTFNELQKVSGIRFSGTQEAEKELAVGQEELLPAVKGGRRDPEIMADLADSTAPAQISFESLKHEPKSVLEGTRRSFRRAWVWPQAHLTRRMETWKTTGLSFRRSTT